MPSAVIIALVLGAAAFAPPTTLRTTRRSYVAVRPAISRQSTSMVLGKLFNRKQDEPEVPTVEAAPPTVEAGAEPVEEISLIGKADALHAAKKPVELFELLKDADTSDVEVAWRVARAHHDMAEETADAAAREKLLREGLIIAEAALEATPDAGFALKWYAILLGRLGDFLPTKEKVANSYKIKESLVRAAELLPTDASVQTAIGQWCLKPPESSYQEALTYFEASHAIRPSKKASLQAGQACEKLARPTDAAGWYRLTLELPSAGIADEEIDKQAQAALR